MIDVKDLMIGNFVKKRGEILVVGKIHRESVADKWGGLVFDDEIEGVPVTKEILKEIGFEEYEDLPLEGVFYRYWDKDYKYKLDVRDFWTNSQRKWYVHIDNDVCNTIGSGEFDYVHELQSLVRINCKADLPITKEVFDGLGNDA
jgi:hypothetical protein